MSFPLAALQGSFPPLVTPFLDGEVDYKTYASLAMHLIDGGSHGLVVNGTTGEPTALTIVERTKLVETAVRVSDGRVPVVAATGSQSYDDTLRLSKEAESAGVDALMVVTPYFIKPPVRGMIEYYVALASQTDLPVLIYHIPGRAGISLPPTAIAEIAGRAKNLVGVKHASTDLGFVTEVLALLGPDFKVFVGLEELSFPMMAIGACGLMNAAGNVVPDRVAALATAALTGDMAQARRLHFDLIELNQAIFWDTNPIPMKYMMYRMGIIPNNEHRLPMASATPELERRLDELLDRLNLGAVV